ncbi:phenylalanine--tRNA ligase subunit alpha [Aciditerrimonas ferrireducens]|uniref:Phenylalanine--tRNA ligase alpha subunit n=1 Tax=Aciditerrimonas ferrireducens TaxID=667306 RepID=A0ABV6C5A4_9ACTN
MVGEAGGDAEGQEGPLADPAVDPAGWTAGALARIDSATSLAALEGLAQALTGKASALAQAHRRLGSLDAAERRAVGQALHEARTRVQVALAERRAQVAAAEREAQVAAERLDLSEVLAAVGAAALGARSPAMLGVAGRGHRHLVERTREELEEVFVGLGFEVAEGPEVETDWFNFEALHMPPGHPARGMFDTFYLEVAGAPPGAVLLRTHTSPVQVRLLRSRPLPLAVVIPGRCYRRDTPDARHLPTFHQVEGLVVGQGVTFGDLAGTIEAFTQAYFGPRIAARLRPAFFPFTEPSAEFEITCTICEGAGCRTCSQTGWVELGGCGMVDPAVLEAAGVDPEAAQGFAFGFGIDRLAQMRHGIADMRVLLDNDLRLLRQP